MTMPDIDEIAELFEGVCWNCGGLRLIITPDDRMQWVTDMIVCVDCGEIQSGEGE